MIRILSNIIKAVFPHNSSGDMGGGSWPARQKGSYMQPPSAPWLDSVVFASPQLSGIYFAPVSPVYRWWRCAHQALWQSPWPAGWWR